MGKRRKYSLLESGVTEYKGSGDSRRYAYNGNVFCFRRKVYMALHNKYYDLYECKSNRKSGCKVNLRLDVDLNLFYLSDGKHNHSSHISCSSSEERSKSNENEREEGMSKTRDFNPDQIRKAQENSRGRRRRKGISVDRFKDFKETDVKCNICKRIEKIKGRAAKVEYLFLCESCRSLRIVLEGVQTLKLLEKMVRDKFSKRIASEYLNVTSFVLDNFLYFLKKKNPNLNDRITEVLNYFNRRSATPPISKQRKYEEKTTAPQVGTTFFPSASNQSFNRKHESILKNNLQKTTTIGGDDWKIAMQPVVSRKYQEKDRTEDGMNRVASNFFAGPVASAANLMNLPFGVPELIRRGSSSSLFQETAQFAGNSVKTLKDDLAENQANRNWAKTSVRQSSVKNRKFVSLLNPFNKKIDGLSQNSYDLDRRFFKKKIAEFFDVQTINATCKYSGYNHDGRLGSSTFVMSFKVIIKRYWEKFCMGRDFVVWSLFFDGVAAGGGYPGGLTIVGRQVAVNRSSDVNVPNVLHNSELEKLKKMMYFVDFAVTCLHGESEAQKNIHLNKHYERLYGGLNRFTCFQVQNKKLVKLYVLNSPDLACGREVYIDTPNLLLYACSFKMYSIVECVRSGDKEGIEKLDLNEFSAKFIRICGNVHPLNKFCEFIRTTQSKLIISSTPVFPNQILASAAIPDVLEIFGVEWKKICEVHESEYTDKQRFPTIHDPFSFSTKKGLSFFYNHPESPICRWDKSIISNFAFGINGKSFHRDRLHYQENTDYKKNKKIFSTTMKLRITT